MIVFDHDRTWSDGMSGRVTLVETDTGDSATVHWSVSNPDGIFTQAIAKLKAEDLLRALPKR
jgi:hypothetical protein